MYVHHLHNLQVHIISFMTMAYACDVAAAVPRPIRCRPALTTSTYKEILAIYE